MGRNTDRAGIQFRMINTSKGAGGSCVKGAVR